MAKKECGEEGGAPLACHICMKEIPSDVAHTAEGQEYVHYFCGVDCYRQWQERHEREHPGERERQG